jgi:hypothetical protein
VTILPGIDFLPPRIESTYSAQCAGSNAAAYDAVTMASITIASARDSAAAVAYGRS